MCTGPTTWFAHAMSYQQELEKKIETLAAECSSSSSSQQPNEAEAEAASEERHAKVALEAEVREGEGGTEWKGIRSSQVVWVHRDMSTLSRIVSIARCCCGCRFATLQPCSSCGRRQQYDTQNIKR